MARENGSAETRKLQEVGGGTYTVSVPKEWADENRVEAGSTVHLYSHADGSIVLRAAEKDDGNLASARVEVAEESPERVERALRAAHAVGFDAVTLVPVGSFTDAQRRTARSVVRRLAGTELFENGDEAIAVRNLLDAANVSIRQSVSQLEFVALSMHRGATAAFRDADPAAGRSIAERDDEADRLAGLVARHFGRSLCSLAEVDRLGLGRPEVHDYHETARRLEAVADRAVEIARAGERLDAPPPDAVADDVEQVADAAREVVEDATTALTAPEADRAHAALDARDAIRADLAAVEDRLFGGTDEEAREVDETGEAVGETTGKFDGSPADAVALARVLDALRRTADAGGTIAEVALRADRRRRSL